VAPPLLPPSPPLEDASPPPPSPPLLPLELPLLLPLELPLLLPLLLPLELPLLLPLELPLLLLPLELPLLPLELLLWLPLLLPLPEPDEDDPPPPESPLLHATATAPSTTSDTATKPVLRISHLLRADLKHETRLKHPGANATRSLHGHHCWFATMTPAGGAVPKSPTRRASPLVTA
jgi:hypothetical protein